jgi:hypothetical protein
MALIVLEGVIINRDDACSGRGARDGGLRQCGACTEQ